MGGHGHDSSLLELMYHVPSLKPYPDLILSGHSLVGLGWTQR